MTTHRIHKRAFLGALALAAAGWAGDRRGLRAARLTFPENQAKETTP